MRSVTSMGMDGVITVWQDAEEGCIGPVLTGPMGSVSVPRVVFNRSMYGPNLEDEDWEVKSDGDIGDDDGSYQGAYRKKHGRSLPGDVHSQTPIPYNMRGGGELGPTGKVPATMVGADTVGQIFQGQVQPALKGQGKRFSATIGSVARQSYQFVRSCSPVTAPFNAFGNPAGPEIRSINATIPPALEPKRYNLTGLDTDYIQQQADILNIKAAMIERGQ